MAASAFAVSPFGTVEVSIRPPPARLPTDSSLMATAVAWSFGMPTRAMNLGIASLILSFAARPVTTMCCLSFAMGYTIARKGADMPVKRVRGGFRWGRRGKVYPTVEQAMAQGIAAYARGYRPPPTGEGPASRKPKKPKR